ncbi:hypothetical protein CPB84DRAFT_1679441 [Gymnopilus junonius]|uniref:Uncharacterized protein n=1 Tax=Gymnopilus junonius TaxID=109634 RepID=A0A9P5TMU6_GYMJU|nr:hypothetical protein CPB84DRAFT_1679441 [Gymnopilus junonius]
MATTEDETEKKTVRLSIPQRVLGVCGTAFVVGTAIGIMRGGRAASLRFLAENAHRPPTTVQGWYFYKKTKNYKVMLGALKGAGTEASRLTGLSLAYVGIEEGLQRTGWGGVKEVGAGVGRRQCSRQCVDGLPRQMAMRAIGLGGIAGGVMTAVEWGRERERPAGSPEARSYNKRVERVD